MASDEGKDKIQKAAALSYNPEEGGAPKVMATGKGEIARKIIETAMESNVPVYQDEHLAEVLSGIKIGSEIPPELYEVVAEVLAFISKMDEKFAKRWNYE